MATFFMASRGQEEPFFIGLGCVMSHTLHIPVLILAGIAQICQNLYKIVSISTRAFPIAQIHPNSHRSVQTCRKSFLAAPSILSPHGKPERARKGPKGPDEASYFEM